MFPIESRVARSWDHCLFVTLKIVRILLLNIWSKGVSTATFWRLFSSLTMRTFPLIWYLTSIVIFTWTHSSCVPLALFLNDLKPSSSSLEWTKGLILYPLKSMGAGPLTPMDTGLGTLRIWIWLWVWLLWSQELQQHLCGVLWHIWQLNLWKVMVGGRVAMILLKWRQYGYWLDPGELLHTTLLMHMMELLYACSTHASQLQGLSSAEPAGHDAMGQAMPWFCDVDKQELEITCEVEESLMH